MSLLSVPLVLAHAAAPEAPFVDLVLERVDANPATALFDGRRFVPVTLVLVNDGTEAARAVGVSCHVGRLTLETVVPVLPARVPTRLSLPAPEGTRAEDLPRGLVRARCRLRAERGPTEVRTGDEAGRFPLTFEAPAYADLAFDPDQPLVAWSCPPETVGSTCLYVRWRNEGPAAYDFATDLECRLVRAGVQAEAGAALEPGAQPGDWTLTALPLATTLPPGEYFGTCTLDAAGRYREEDEANTVTATVRVAGPDEAPDLVVEALPFRVVLQTSPPRSDSAMAPPTLRVAVRVANRGAAIAVWGEVSCTGETSTGERLEGRTAWGVPGSDPWWKDRVEPGQTSTVVVGLSVTDEVSDTVELACEVRGDGPSHGVIAAGSYTRDLHGSYVFVNDAGGGTSPR